jgi:hypothetical protein
MIIVDAGKKNFKKKDEMPFSSIQAYKASRMNE